jgi:predicted phosphohydrolase
MIRLVSDLHLEFHQAQFEAGGYPYAVSLLSDILKPLPDDDKSVLILAGDILLLKHINDYEHFFTVISERFKTVLWVFGNHEWFGNKMKIERIIAAKEKMLPYGNIHILNNETYEDEDYHFIGTTLWSDIKKGDYMTALDVVAVSNDFKKIDFKEGNRYSKLRPRQVTKMFMDNEQFIQAELLRLKGSPKKKVVITHHPPTEKAITDRMKLHPDFWSDFGNVKFSYFVEHDIVPDLWVHGHVHEKQDIKEGELDIISNARGYDDFTKSGESMLNKGFDPNFVINIISA